MATATNISCLLYGAGDVKFEERPVPSLDDRPNDVLVQIAYTGVCGSDVSYLELASSISNNVSTNPGTLLGPWRYQQHGTARKASDHGS
jgi:threonine dehydrogenase-like Zn-dependent dehydrogenase